MSKKITYLAAVYEDENGAYTTVFPDFPELAPDFGANFDDAVDQASAFVSDAVEYMVEHGKSLPAPTRGEEFKAKLDPDAGVPYCMVPVTVYPPAKTERINVFAKGDQLAAITDFAKRKHRSRSELMVTAALEYIKGQA
ncbi:MAG: type II toxin-antitoxin system HicB family antitoxin [Victivallaceae bacterium]|nr:type II toxin-antitoxin system HicB family antitoxin [Victivallaceae bacterium]